MEYSAFFEKARAASRDMVSLEAGSVNQVLKDVSQAAVEKTEFLLQENKKDLARMDPSDPRYDRLKLTTERIAGIAADIARVSELPDPLRRVLSEGKLENGLQVSRVSVPLGVVGIEYEARPNVTFDVFALCFKTGNVAVLKGGSDAAASKIGKAHV